MTTQPDQPSDREPIDAADASTTDGAPSGPDGAGAEPQPDALAQLEAEKLDLKDRLLRALADMENMRRRTERDVADARVYAVTGFARDMLNVADNMRRAIESVPKGEAEGGAIKTLMEGVELTERDLQKILERHGVKRLSPEGGRFDPNMHQAMFEVPNEEVPAGTVLQVVQTGYAIGERVLRPAMVGVSKGGPRPVPAAGEGSGAERS